MADITGQSLPIHQDLDFAGLDDACFLSHVPPRRTSPNRLGVNCDVVVVRAMLSLANAIRLSPREAVGKVGAR
jgi:hypothetical protein